MRAISVPLLCICMLTAVMTMGCNNQQNNADDKFYFEAQKRWAEKYHVSIEDYPYPLSFPAYYFVSNLKKGDSIEKVHAVIQGYEEVYQCDTIEDYFFFSTVQEKRLRFLVLYDKNLQYEGVSIEGRDSGNLGPPCGEEGLITSNGK